MPKRRIRQKVKRVIKRAVFSARVLAGRQLSGKNIQKAITGTVDETVRSSRAVHPEGKHEIVRSKRFFTGVGGNRLVVYDERLETWPGAERDVEVTPNGIRLGELQKVTRQKLDRIERHYDSWGRLKSKVVQKNNEVRAYDYAPGKILRRRRK